MNDADAIAEIKHLIEERPDADRREIFQWLRQRYPIHPLEKEFGTTAEVILEAISRSNDLTKRGIRGIIAEAYFKVEVIEKTEGWNNITPSGEYPFDFLIEQGQDKVSIQVKLQRSKNHEPMKANEAYRFFSSDLYVTETQKTRGGTDAKTKNETRPYRFGEFDILAVSMQPTTKKWSDFRYTVGRWLLADPADKSLLLKFQPVSLIPNDDWTDSLATCIEWFKGGVEKKIGGVVGEISIKPRRKKEGNKGGTDA